jgi:NAD(P)-dependent dehydrogenase (short-subunit alcohol dehydrogenase family)
MNVGTNRPRLDKKIILLAGAAGTIGQSITRCFAAEGARLVLVDRDAARLSLLANELGPEICVTLAADVTSAEAMASAVELAKSNFGGLDVFIANAGVEGVWSKISEYPQDVYDTVMSVNVKSVFTGLQAVLGEMRDGGSIIITSSVMGLIGSASNIAYTASKHAVVGLRRSAAIEAGKRGIRVNTIHPGFVESEMLTRLMSSRGDTDAARARYAGMAKLGRLVNPTEIASAALFLASDDSCAITNQALVVDAGVLD